VAALPAGGVVHLAPGEHVVTTPVRLPSGTTVLGAGPDRTTVSLAPGSGCHVFTNARHGAGDHDITLRGFRIEGNLRNQERRAGDTGTSFACGGYFMRATNVSIDDVVAQGIRQTAFHFSHCAHVRVERVTADELGWSGVSTSGTDDITLLRLTVTNAGLDVRHSGIHLDGGQGAHLDVLVDGCSGNAVMLGSKYAPMHDAVVRAVARRSRRGLALFGQGEHPLTNVLVSGDFSDNRECGVLVFNASHVFIVDATIASNDHAGVVLQGTAASQGCVLARCRITGNPAAIRELDGNRIAYTSETTAISTSVGVLPLAGEPLGSPVTAPAASTGRRGRLVRGAVRRARRLVVRSAARRPAVDVGDDCYDGTCSVCGSHQVFVRRASALREGYRCVSCRASLRYRAQADAILRRYAAHGASSLAELVDEPGFGGLAVWEPGVLGPFRPHLRRLPGYVESDYWPDVPPGGERDGVRCEDLMALTFPASAFDLVLTSDIFEHVRRPAVAFAEVHRVLRPGGRHIFSIPIQEPWQATTVARVDTSGDEDVLLCEARYHLGPKKTQHLVYNDFGRDLLDVLDGVGFDTEVQRFEAPSAEASRALTLCSTKRP
jgi:hypothetical protein